MKLIIGGYAQGKLKYVLQNYCLGADSVWEGTLPTGKPAAETLAGEDEAGVSPVVINRFHIWFRERLEAGEAPEAVIREYVTGNPDCIIISDEVGNGIVPMDALEREYRERLGRILVELAQNAEEVVRVICGLGQKIK